MPLDDDFVQLAGRVRNWGRWGDDDELGTLNLIDAAAVQRGVACAQTGKTFNLSIPLDDNGPQIGFIPGRYNPIHKVFQINEVTIGDPDGTRFSDDQMDLALQACTHWDALSHSSYGGNLWNGHPADAITEAGAGKCGIGLVTSIVTRGVLLDIARLQGVDVIPRGHAVHRCDARRRVRGGERHRGAGRRRAAAHRARCRCSSPATARATRRRTRDRRWRASTGSTTTTSPPSPPTTPRSSASTSSARCRCRCTRSHLVEMGMTQGQNWNLEAFAADCAADGRYHVPALGHARARHRRYRRPRSSPWRSSSDRRSELRFGVARPAHMRGRATPNG